MTIALLEGAVDALDTYLEANIAAKIATINTRYSSSLVVPKAWYLGSLPMAIPEFPSACIHGIGFTTKAQRPTNIHAVYDLNLLVFHGGDDVEARFRALCRYGVAMVELIKESQATIGYTMYIGPKIMVTEPMGTEPYLQGIIIPVTMEKVETY